MKIDCLVSVIKEELITDRLSSDSNPNTGDKPWGTKEATWDGEKWVGVYPWELVFIDVEPQSEDFEIELNCSFGILRVMASDFKTRLIIDG